MSVEQAIHEHWSHWKPLTDLVPSARVWTADVPEATAKPYVSLRTSDKQQVTRTSAGNIIINGVLMFQLVAGTLSEVKEIGAEILSHFNRAGFDWSRGKVLDMRPGPDNYEEAMDGEAGAVWLGTVDFDYRLLQNTGT